MTYVDLPRELWYEILTRTPAETAVNFLATASEIRQEFLPGLQERLDQAKAVRLLERRKRKVREWLRAITQKEFTRNPSERGGEHGLRPVSRALTALLGPSFPRVLLGSGAGSELFAVINERALLGWVRKYLQQKGLEASVNAGTIDETLAQLAGTPAGTTMYYHVLCKDLIMRNRAETTSPGMCYDLRLIKHLSFIETYYEVLETMETVITPLSQGSTRNRILRRELEEIDPDFSALLACDLKDPPLWQPPVKAA